MFRKPLDYVKHELSPRNVKDDGENTQVLFSSESQSGNSGTLLPEIWSNKKPKGKHLYAYIHIALFIH